MKAVLNNPWFYRCCYIVGMIILLAAEFGAIFNDASGDTITENTRNVIDIAPILWYSTLGLYLGIGIWLTRHFWWRKK